MIYLMASGVFLYSVLRRILFGRWVWWSVVLLATVSPVMAVEETDSDQRWIEIIEGSDSYTPTSHLWFDDYEFMTGAGSTDGIMRFRFFDDSLTAYGVIHDLSGNFSLIRCVVRRVSEDWLRVDLYSDNADFNAHAYYEMFSWLGNENVLYPWRTPEVTCEGGGCSSDDNRAWNGDFPGDPLASEALTDARRNTRILLYGDWGALSSMDTPGGNYADPSFSGPEMDPLPDAVVPGIDTNVLDGDATRLGETSDLTEGIGIIDSATVSDEMIEGIATPQLETGTITCSAAGASFINAVNWMSGIYSTSIHNSGTSYTTPSATTNYKSVWGYMGLSDEVSAGTPTAMAQYLACEYEDIIDAHFGVVPVAVSVMFGVFYLIMCYSAAKSLVYFGMGIQPPKGDG